MVSSVFSVKGRCHKRVWMPSTPGLNGLSRNSASFITDPKMSSRNPSTPRRSQKRTASNMASLTSGLR